jgi:hypothetical protein
MGSDPPPIAATTWRCAVSPSRMRVRKRLKIDFADLAALRASCSQSYANDRHCPARHFLRWAHNNNDISRLKAYIGGCTADLGCSMTYDVLGALWFITLLVGFYGVAIGELCLWRRD